MATAGYASRPASEADTGPLPRTWRVDGLTFSCDFDSGRLGGARLAGDGAYELFVPTDCEGTWWWAGRRTSAHGAPLHRAYERRLVAAADKMAALLLDAQGCMLWFTEIARPALPAFCKCRTKPLQRISRVVLLQHLRRRGGAYDSMPPHESAHGEQGSCGLALALQDTVLG
jgi:hypothetical protein